MACELCDRWSPTTCDKCGTVVPAAFVAIETQGGAPIDDPRGFMWCVVCHGKRVDAVLRERTERAEAALIVEAKSALLCNDALVAARAVIAGLEEERDHYRTVFANASDQRESARDKLAEANKRWEQLREPLRQWAAMNDRERREKKVPMFPNPHTILAWMAALETKEGT